MLVRRLPARPVRLALPLFLLLGLLFPLLSTETLGQTSPAHGDAQVIAQGLTAPPADRSAWRVVRQDIPERIDAVPSVRMQSATGFLLADETAIFVADQKTKLRTRLAPGEAQFVTAGANQTWASLDDKAGTAYSLELVDRDVAKVSPGGDIVYASSSFAIDPGDYDLDLIRDDVPGGEKVTIDEGNFPVLVLVTGGQVEITSSRTDDKVRLKTGQAVALRGNLTVRTRGDDTATYVAAVLGDAVSGGQAIPTVEATSTTSEDATRAPKATKTPKADKKTPTPETTPDEDVPGIGDGASLRIAVRLCRRGMTTYSIDPRGCARAEGDFQIALIAPDGTRLRLSDASKVTATFVRWSGLEEGDYVLVVGSLPEGYFSYSLDGYLCCSTNDGYRVVIGKDQLLDGTLYLFQAEWGVGQPTAAPVVPTAIAQPTQPSTQPDPGLDSDGDGLSDQLEQDVFGTSPFLTDSDGDTIPDGTEAFGLNGWLTAPALPDTDGDGVDDNVEIQQGTSPLDPSSS